MGELAEFTLTVLSDPDIDALALRYDPFAVARLHHADVNAALADPTIRRIMFTRGRADLRGIGNLELLDANPGALVLDVGREGPTGLSESWLAASVGRASWKRPLQELNLRTVAGVVGVHEKTGATGVYRAHRLSPGAVAPAKSGTALRPFPSSPVVLRPREG